MSNKGLAREIARGEIADIAVIARHRRHRIVEQRTSAKKRAKVKG